VSMKVKVRSEQPAGASAVIGPCQTDKVKPTPHQAKAACSQDNA